MSLLFNNNKAEIDSSGDLVLTSQPHVRSYRETAQSMPNGAWTTVIFSTESADVQGEYDNTTGIFAATTAGVYFVAWEVCTAVSAWTIGELVISALVRDSAAPGSNADTWIGARWTSFGTGSLAITSHGSAIVKLAATETLEVKMYHNQGAAINVIDSGLYNKFQIVKVS
jgi:hypothetical protein